MSSNLEKSIHAYFNGVKGVISAYLFGSQAKKLATASSDVDIAIHFKPDSVPDFRTLMTLKQKLSEKLHRNVDLVVMNQANPILKHQIFQYGKKIFDKSYRDSSNFFVKSMFEYDDIKKVRAPIEKAILKGRVYGG